MTLTNYVSLTITRDSVGVARAGFGVPLLVSYNTTGWTERVRSYNTLLDVADDFATTTVEYLAAQKLFGQSPRLETLKIGRGALPPTLVNVVTVGTPVNAHVYVVNVVGEGFSGTATTAASDGSATNDEVVALLVTALNGVAGNNYTAAATGSAGSQVVTVTADAAGDWFSLEVANADIGNLTVATTNVDPGIATDLAAIALEDPAWYALATVYNSKLMVAAAAAWIETQDRIYLVATHGTTNATVAVASADDIGEDTFDSGYGRTSVWYHPDPSDFAALALYGRCLPLEPGSETWALKTLAGVEPVTRTATHRTNILARNANSYEQVTSDVRATYNGTMADGEYIDVVRGLDWLRDDMSKAVFEVLAGNDKVPFTDAGIRMIQNAMKGSLKRAENRGIITAGWTTTVPLASAVSTGDKALRRLTNLKFSATLAGAVHSTDIDGSVSV